MKFRKSLIGAVISMAATNGFTSASANEYEVLDSALLLQGQPVITPPSTTQKKSGSAPYIVQLKGESGVNHAERIGELTSSNPGSVQANNSYNSLTPLMAAYTAAMEARQDKVAGDIRGINIIHNYVHTFNGFAAVLTNEQVNALRNHPDVIAVHEDELQKPATANTPEFLGLTSGEGQHVSGFLGEDIIVGVVDSGIAPDNASFTDPDALYGDPADLGWTGVCNEGDVPIRDDSFEVEFDGADPTFSCNNKLIGARYFGGVLDAQYGIKTDLGEFISPRDASGHGSHTAGTAAGNAGVTASLSGIDIATITGIAPRARIAAYKVCWNDDYVTPEGVDEAGCFGGDSMAAIDAAVADGVDVINYSISGSRTSLIAPQTLAMLNATDAGVFVSVSAGNSGPDAVTVGTPAPWVTSVANSTYDGVSVVNGMEITSRDPQQAVAFTEGAITAPLASTGAQEGALVIAEPLNGCFVADVSAPLDNAADINGNIAFIQRGGCNFSQKVERAQLAGASAVVIYTVEGNPVTVLGGDGSYDIPGGMIGFEDGEALHAAITGGEEVEIKISTTSFLEQTEVGNLIASSSSRGPNGSTGDIIKPDITAPGTRILAAYTDTKFQGIQGETNAYLSGTSMSAPHIAGMAILLKEEHPDWTPAQIKSALMTSARQNLTKQEDDGIAADPFDFGAGHAVPVSARAPGLTYNAGYDDYLGVLCGLGENATVLSESGLSCNDVADSISTDPSQLNYPSISIGELGGTETIHRTVTDVSGIDSSYTYTLEAPEGISATVDLSGLETLEVSANGTASYSITFETTDDTVYNEWVFGAITFTGDNGIEVRSPIAIFPVPEINITVPESISTKLSRGRTSFPVQMLYTGTTSLDYAGLVAPFGSSRTVSQDVDQTFAFNEPGLGVHVFGLPDSKVVRFSLTDNLVSVEGADLDLFVWYLSDGGWVQLDQSATNSSNENVILTDIQAGTYAVFVHGWGLAGQETADYTLLGWVADQAESTTTVRGSSRAVDGRFNTIRVTTKDLDPNSLYMGGVTFYNAEGQSQGTTVLEIQP